MMSGNKEQKKWIGYHDKNIHHLPFPYPEKLKEKSSEKFFRDSLKNCKEKLISKKISVGLW